MTGYKLQDKYHSTQNVEPIGFYNLEFTWGGNQNSFVRVLIDNDIVNIKNWDNYNYWCVPTDCFEEHEEELVDTGISWYKVYDITIIYIEGDDLCEVIYTN